MKKNYFILMCILILASSSVMAILNNTSNVSVAYIMNEATSVFTTSNQEVLIDVDPYGNELSLTNDEGLEVIYDNGMYAESNTVITFNNLREKGYNRLQMYIGASFITNETNNLNTSIIFEFLVDGNVVYKSGVFDRLTPQEFVDINLLSAEVLQIKILNADGNYIGDYAVLGNPMFVKNGDHPTLEVYDIEFSDHKQITEYSLMEYVTSYDVDGTDLTENITYTTNYKKDVDGIYDVTYKTVGKSGDSYERTIQIDIQTIDYTKEMSIDEFKTPFVNYLYHGRNVLDEQGRKIFDLVVDETLNFDSSKYDIINRWNTEVYLLEFNLFDENIYTSKSEIERLSANILDSEQRLFTIPDWNFEYVLEDGLVKTLRLWVRVNLIEEQNNYFNILESNTQMHLDVFENDMTYAQKYDVVMNSYANWIKYADGGTIYDSLVLGQGKCNGHSRGASYLAQRLGIKSIYAAGYVGESAGYHAWTYNYLPDTDNWYLTDKLWGRILAAPLEYIYSDTIPYYQLSTNRMSEYFTQTTTSYPKEKLRYPSAWIETTTDHIILKESQVYDLTDYISSVGSIFDTLVEISDVDFEITNISTVDLSKGFLSTFDYKGDGSDLYKGEYKVLLKLNVEGYIITKEVYLTVVDEITDLNHGVSTTDNIGLYDGENEVYFDDAIVLSDNQSIIIDLSKYNDLNKISFNYGIKDSVRQNLNYGHYANVYLEIYLDDILVLTTNNFGWKTKYENIVVDVNGDYDKLTIKQISTGGNGHSAITDLTSIIYDGNAHYTEYVPGEEIIVSPTEFNPGNVKVYCILSGTLLESTPLYRITFKENNNYVSHIDFKKDEFPSNVSLKAPYGYNYVYGEMDFKNENIVVSVTKEPVTFNKNIVYKDDIYTLTFIYGTGSVDVSELYLNDSNFAGIFTKEGLLLVDKYGLLQPNVTFITDSTAKLISLELGELHFKYLNEDDELITESIIKPSVDNEDDVNNESENDNEDDLSEESNIEIFKPIDDEGDLNFIFLIIVSALIVVVICLIKKINNRRKEIEGY